MAYFPPDFHGKTPTDLFRERLEGGEPAQAALYRVTKQLQQVLPDPIGGTGTPTVETVPPLPAGWRLIDASTTNLVLTSDGVIPLLNAAVAILLPDGTTLPGDSVRVFALECVMRRNFKLDEHGKAVPDEGFTKSHIIYAGRPSPTIYAGVGGVTEYIDEPVTELAESAELAERTESVADDELAGVTGRKARAVAKALLVLSRKGYRGGPDLQRKVIDEIPENVGPTKIKDVLKELRKRRLIDW